MRIRMAKIQTISLPPMAGLSPRARARKSDQGHARDAVSLETVRCGADTVTGVVARTVGNDAGIFRIVFGKVEDDLHEVGTDVSDSW